VFGIVPIYFLSERKKCLRIFAGMLIFEDHVRDRWAAANISEQTEAVEVIKKTIQKDKAFVLVAP
jgi:hypothetical protein